jgi:hypothetical protein
MIEFRSNPQPTCTPRQSCCQIAVNRIADAIRELAGSGEPITEEALIARDIPPAVIARYADQARQVARRSFVKRG